MRREHDVGPVPRRHPVHARECEPGRFLKEFPLQQIVREDGTSDAE